MIRNPFKMKLKPGCVDEYKKWQLSSLGIDQSMSAKGNCYDSAAQESFYGRYKTSSVRGRSFLCEEEARSNAFETIEVFFNRFRKHSSLDYQNRFSSKEKFAPMGASRQAFRPA
jgi:putative transposase